MDQSSSGGRSDRQGGSRPRGNRNRSRQRQKGGNQARRQNQAPSDSGGGQGKRPAKKQGQNQQGQSRQGQGRQNQNRSRQRREGVRRRQAPAGSWWQKLLAILTFGRLGKNGGSKPKQKNQAKRPQAKVAQPPASANRPQIDDSPARAAIMQEVTSPRLFVGNLDYDANESDLEDLFKGVGHVVNVEIATNPRTQQSKGFGFVEMSHLDEARRAVTVLHDQDFRGRKLIVSGARNDRNGAPRESEEEPKPEAAIDPAPIAAPEPERNHGETDSAAA